MTAATSIASFRVDVTPPLGSPLCGGLVAPARSVTDPLYAIGALLLGTGAPLLICAVDWCEINNDAHAAWVDELARAAGTTPDRVALHSVHQHNAPIVDTAAQRLVEGVSGLSPVMDTAHFRSCVERTGEAVRAALSRARPVTGLALGSAVVREVASARRIIGDDGRVRLTRWSSAPDPEIRAEPEGTIDPVLRTITFYDGNDAMLSLHFYATHPMSHYGDGAVTSDFAGLARERRCAQTPGWEHIYWNGCGGNITAGKYNDGSPESRVRLTQRMHAAIEESERNASPRALGKLAWASMEIRLPHRAGLAAPELAARIADPALPQNDRKTAALRLAWLHRLDTPVRVARLRMGTDASILFLPGEPFVEYQLFASSRAAFVATAGYGDAGTGYIPLARSYVEGGYEIEASGVSEGAEPLLKDAITKLLSP